MFIRSAVPLFCRTAFLSVAVFATSASAAFAQQFVSFDIAGADRTIALDINNRGQIVGFYRDTMTHGFLIDKRALTTIDVPEATSTVAMGINERGLIAGYYSDGSTTHRLPARQVGLHHHRLSRCSTDLCIRSQ